MLLLERFGSSMLLHGQSAAYIKGPYLGLLSSRKHNAQEAGPRNHSLRCRRVCRLQAQSNDYQEPTQGQERRKVLLKYVQDVQPQIMEQFADQTAPQVVNAMRQTITNMLGTLPPQFFTVTITTVGENLAQLMFSVMMTGYMLRNAQYRLDLKNSFNMASPASTLPNSGSSSAPNGASLPAAVQPVLPPSPAQNVRPVSSSSIVLSSFQSQPSVPALPPTPTSPPALPQSVSARSNSTTSTSMTVTSGSSLPAHPFLADEGYAPGVQKTRVSGEVLRWHHTNGVETMTAVQYMELLEAEVAALRERAQVAPPPRPPPVAAPSTLTLDTSGSPSGCELLDYLKSLDASALAELTAGAGDDISDAMHTFIRRLMGSDDKAELRSATSDCTAVELAKLLFWLMVVGYGLRTMEVRMEMDRRMDLGLSGGDGGQGGKRLPGF